MQLDSYLEIFTTMYGWAFANIIGEAIAGTGLVVLPFLLIVFNGWREAKESGQDSAGVLGLIDSIGTKLIMAMFVYALCFATTPVTSLLSISLSHTPPPTLLDPEPGNVSRNNTGTTFDNALANAVDGSFSDSENLSYVPAWWFTSMAISSGLNHAMRSGLRNSGSPMRMLEDMARSATIQDPQLLGQVQRFYSECFVPARSRYMGLNSSTDLSTDGLAIIAADNADYGPTDVDWMGSQLFRTEPGFYPAMRATYPVPGFAIDFDRDTDYHNPDSGVEPPNPGQVNPDWGRPTCGQWWLALRESLVSHSQGWQQLLASVTNTLSFSSEDKTKDEVARLAATKANPHFVDAERLLGTDYDTTTSLGRTLTGAISTLGVGKEAFFASVAMTPIIQGLPMAQALLLMGLYMFLPLMVFFSGYDLQAMFVGAVAIFTVKLFAVLWAIAAWVDGHLINAMYPGALGSIIMQEITQVANGAIPAGYKRMLLNILLMFMFIALPMLWVAMMGWVGVRMSSGLSELVGRTDKLAGGVGATSAPRVRR